MGVPVGYIDAEYLEANGRCADDPNLFPSPAVEAVHAGAAEPLQRYFRGLVIASVPIGTEAFIDATLACKISEVLKISGTTKKMASETWGGWSLLFSSAIPASTTGYATSTPRRRSASPVSSTTSSGR